LTGSTQRRCDVRLSTADLFSLSIDGIQHRRTVAISVEMKHVLHPAAELEQSNLCQIFVDWKRLNDAFGEAQHSFIPVVRISNNDTGRLVERQYYISRPRTRYVCRYYKKKQKNV